MTINEVRKKIEYKEFIEWCGLPSPEREPKLQQELTKKLGVSEATLSLWKKVDGFWNAVAETRKNWAKDKTSDVLYALYKKIKKDGNAAEAKLFLQYTDEFKDRTEVLIENQDRPLSLEDQELIRKAIDMALPENHDE